jgi:programmed cell death 6-interacting protein
MDILDEEASEDEAARRESVLDRPPSHEANSPFIESERKYRHILDQASESDEHVRQKWDDWEQSIIVLTRSEVGPNGSRVLNPLLPLLVLM